VVPRNLFHSEKGTILGTSALVSDQNIRDFLCGRGKEGGKVRSVFERLGIVLDDGASVRITSHQFRHFVDTTAATGGASELVRARWMGRKDLSQNNAYDHESGASLARKIRIRLVEGGMLGPVSEYVLAKDPKNREEAAESLVRATHRTLFGGCFHDWASSPCPEHEACWDCPEHLLIKGDPEHVAEAQKQLGETRSALALANVEIASGTYGAGNWAGAHVKKISRLEMILKIHGDDRIPDGTLVHLRRDGRMIFPGTPHGQT